MLMMFWFSVGDILAGLIPVQRWREWVRRTQLYDFRKKFGALRRAQPELNFRRTRMIKGGWNIGFIIDKKYVFKIRKAYDNTSAIDKIIREKRITDAFSGLLSLRIPRIKIIESDGYTFYRYGFIPGVNLNTMPLKQIQIHRANLGKKLAEFIYTIHNNDPKQLLDLRAPTDINSDGWNHHDICNNIIINPKTMKIIGIIDWEYAGFGPLETEFRNTVQFSKNMMRSGIILDVVIEYYNLCKSSKI